MILEENDKRKYERLSKPPTKLKIDYNENTFANEVVSNYFSKFDE